MVLGCSAIEGQDDHIDLKEAFVAAILALGAIQNHKGNDAVRQLHCRRIRNPRALHQLCGNPVELCAHPTRESWEEAISLQNERCFHIYHAPYLTGKLMLCYLLAHCIELVIAVGARSKAWPLADNSPFKTLEEPFLQERQRK